MERPEYRQFTSWTNGNEKTSRLRSCQILRKVNITPSIRWITQMKKNSGLWRRAYPTGVHTASSNLRTSNQFLITTLQHNIQAFHRQWSTRTHIWRCLIIPSDSRALTLNIPTRCPMCRQSESTTKLSSFQKMTMPPCPMARYPHDYLLRAKWPKLKYTAKMQVRTN